MKGVGRFSVCLVGLVLSFTATAQPIGYSVQNEIDANPVTSVLHSIDLATGTATPIGTGVGPRVLEDLEGLAFDPVTGDLFAVDDSTNQLVTINVATGVGAVVGSLGGFAQLDPGLAISAAGVIFMTADIINGTQLYTVNKTTGAATLVGTSSVDHIDGLAWLNSELWGISPTTDSLYKINTSTGAASLVGSTGINFHEEAGLASDGTDLYGVYDGSPGTSGLVFKINPATGAASTPVATLKGFEGLAIRSASQVIPEPGSLVLLSMGAFAIFIARRRSRSGV